MALGRICCAGPPGGADTTAASTGGAAMTMTIEPQEGCQPWAFPSMCRSGVLILECWKMFAGGVDAENLDGGSVGTEGEDQPLAWWRV